MRNTPHIPTGSRLSRRDVLTRLGTQVGAAWLGLNALPAQARIATINEAINKAGRQRMLSQRMAKAWLAMGQDVESAKARRILDDSMALFDRQFVELKAFAPTEDIRATYVALEPVWSDYKAALIGHEAEKAGAAALLALDARVLKLAHQGTVQLERHSGQATGKLVNMAGRQRMLSQRTAKFYLAGRWNAGQEALAELDKAKAEFRSALVVLREAPQATQAIRDRIDLAAQQWVFFENAMARLNEDSGARRRSSEVFATSETILQIMDQVTGLYTQQA